jgi:hypothetical protein
VGKPRQRLSCHHIHNERRTRVPLALPAFNGGLLMTLAHNLAFIPVRFTLWTLRDKAALRGWQPTGRTLAANPEIQRSMRDANATPNASLKRRANGRPRMPPNHWHWSRPQRREQLHRVRLLEIRPCTLKRLAGVEQTEVSSMLGHVLEVFDVYEDGQVWVSLA